MHILLPGSLLLALAAAVPSSAQVAVSLEKMNVLYAMVDNPLRVAVSDVPDSNLELIPSFGRITRTGVGAYTWSFCTFDTTAATLTVRRIPGGDTIGQFAFRARNFPVQMLLGGLMFPKTIDAGRFKAQQGLVARVGIEAADGLLDVVSFELWRLPPGKDARMVVNQGAGYTEASKRLVADAQPGDEYVIRNIVYRTCGQGLIYSREELSFRIR